jgi:hypothetical protein
MSVLCLRTEYFNSHLAKIFDAPLSLRDNGRFDKHPEFSFEEAHDREKNREDSRHCD